MENQQQVIKKETFGNRAFKVFGILFFIFTCLSFLTAIALDLTGEKTIGKVSNAAVNCSPGKTCWTGKVDFTTTQGEEVSFYPLTLPILFDLDPFLSGRSYDDYGNYQVRYFESVPQIAKIKLAFFLEYSSHLFGLCLGSFLLLIGSAFSASGKPHKPFVIDLSKGRNKS